MAKFIAIIKQHGEGCDYTIGCGLRVIDIDATDKESAFKKLLKNSLFIDVSNGDADPSSLEKLKSVRLIEVADEDKKLYRDWLDSMTSEHARIEEEKAKKKDEEEFERLKKRLGKK